MNHSNPPHHTAQATNIIVLAITILLLLAVSGMICGDTPLTPAAIGLPPIVGFATPSPSTPVTRADFASRLGRTAIDRGGFDTTRSPTPPGSTRRTP